MTDYPSYYQEMEELYQSINICIDLLEETVGTCSDSEMLVLLEDAHSSLEQLSNVIRKYENKE